MKKQAGIWIDHRKAVIVIISEAGEEIKVITSNMEKHVRFSDGDSSEEGRRKTYATGNMGTISTASLMVSSPGSGMRKRS